MNDLNNHILSNHMWLLHVTIEHAYFKQKNKTV